MTRNFPLIQNVRTSSVTHVKSSSLVTSSPFACVKRLRLNTDYLPPSSSEVKNEWTYASASPISLQGAKITNLLSLYNH